MTSDRPALVLPYLDTSPTGAGRLEALRSFAADYTTPDGDALADLAAVQNGTADPEFRAAFVETLNALADLFRTPEPAEQPRLGDLVRITRTRTTVEVFEGTLALAGDDSSSDRSDAADYAIEDARDVTGEFTRRRGLPADETFWIRLHLPGDGYDDEDTIEVIERRVRFDDLASDGGPA